MTRAGSGAGGCLERGRISLGLRAAGRAGLGRWGVLAFRARRERETQAEGEGQRAYRIPAPKPPSERDSSRELTGALLS
jgi:hypothetical protein